MKSARRGWFHALLVGLLGLGSLGLTEVASAQRYRLEVQRPEVRAQFRIGTSARYATSPPPAVRYETPPPAPRTNMEWQPGYWTWNGRQHVWTSGRWAPARRGYAWRQPRWEQRNEGWVMVPGTWVVQQPAPRVTAVYTPAPPPPAPTYDPRYDDSRYYDRDGSARAHRGRNDDYRGRNDDSRDRDGYDYRDRDAFDHDDEDLGYDDGNPGYRLAAGAAYGQPHSFGRRGGTFVWLDQSGVFHLRTVARRERDFSGRIAVEGGGTIQVVGTTGTEPGDRVEQRNRGVRYQFLTNSGIDGVDFVVQGGSCARFRIRDGGAVHVGAQRTRIEGGTFTICR